MKRDNRVFSQRIDKFVEDVLRLVQKLPRNIITMPMIKQLIDCTTSVGANYNEACEAESSRDFCHKMRIAKKELKETRYWLRLLYKHNKNYREEIIKLGKESTELIKIFSTILKKFNSG